MNGGIISGNTVVPGYSDGGGGIAVFGGIFTMHGGVISGNSALNGWGGGVFVRDTGIFKKLPPSGGQNSGIIYGSEATGVDTDGIQLRNTAYTIYYSSSPSGIGGTVRRRNTTAGQTDHIDTTTGIGLSSNGEPPYGQ
jgi:hypothetical protein